jgi:hypothetical protein
MAFNNNTPDDLSRYSVGEIVDLNGVPDFYNAGSSQWLRSATATAASNLSATSRTNLANAGTAASPTVFAQSALSLSYNTYGGYATYPIARISASSVSVIPALYINGAATVGVGAITSAGLRFVATGQTSNRTSDNSSGSNGVVASNDTKIFSYCFTSATALNARSTTNGTTWTAETVTGIPVFATDFNTIAHASSVASTSNTSSGHGGWRRISNATSQFAVFWCGARFVLIGPAATNYMVSLSTDGLAWGGDNTTAVIGATAQPVARDIQFYRNGNNCYLNVGTSYRYSTDGGVTWAASTFAAALSPSSYYLLYNQTDPAKLVIWTTTGYAAYYTADSGATWSANRPLPAANVSGGLAYRGSTLVASDDSSITSVSTDNGSTWTTITAPIGTLGLQTQVNCDANRFYVGILGQLQMLTSSDGVTWTLVTLPQKYHIAAQSGFLGPGIASFSSNTVILNGYSTQSGYSQFAITLDGGVTWAMGQFTVGNTAGGWQGNNIFLTPDGGGMAFQLGGILSSASGPVILKTDVDNGGAFFKTGSTAITPIRTNALAFVRVG